MFQNFITRYGTHYVKAAKFGGQLKIIKTREITDKSQIDDFREEMQEQVNSMVGNARAKQQQQRSAQSSGYSFSAQAGASGFSIGGGSGSTESSTSEESKIRIQNSLIFHTV